MAARIRTHIPLTANNFEQSHTVEYRELTVVNWICVSYVSLFVYVEKWEKMKTL